MAKDYYEILGVSRESTPDQIKIAYHKLAKTWHPDRNHAPDAKKKFQDISEAYQVLTDDRRRREYDLAWGSGGRFDFKIQSDFFKSSDELYREFFGGKTLDESLADFLNDPMFADLKYADSMRENKSSSFKQKAPDSGNPTRSKATKTSSSGSSSDSRANSLIDESSWEQVDKEKEVSDMSNKADHKIPTELKSKDSSEKQTSDGWLSEKFNGFVTTVTNLANRSSTKTEEKNKAVVENTGSQQTDYKQMNGINIPKNRTEANITEDQCLNHIKNVTTKEEIQKIIDAALKRSDELDFESTGKEN